MNGLSRRSKESLFSVLPAGVVMPFAGNAAPQGWGFCNGSVISRSEYPELFLALGVAHGQGDGSTTFHLPDYRGRYMRGIDAGAGRDPDAGSRTVSNTGGNTGDSVGSVQGDATRNPGFGGSSGGISANHHHYLIANTSSNSAISSSNTYVSRNSNVGNATEYTITHTGTGASLGRSGNVTSDHSHSVTVTGGNTETRAKNANVNYIIKL